MSNHLALRLAALAAAALLAACAAPGRDVEPAAQPETAQHNEAPIVEATPTAAPSPTEAPAPVVEVKTVTVNQTIPFRRTTVNDSSLAKGTTRVRTRGVAGEKTLTYEVTFTDGVETGRKLVKETVTRAPVTEVVAVGTKQTQQCDPNYSGACVPIASDVDCAGGSGNGPAYVRGPVRVIGTDIYDLDSDNDGIGCE